VPIFGFSSGVFDGSEESTAVVVQVDITNGVSAVFSVSVNYMKRYENGTLAATAEGIISHPSGN
jgi:hypothetical protein